MKNKVWTAVLAALIAFGLWVYVVTVVRPETTKTYYNIPVALEGESILTERGLMIVEGKDTTITMEVYGNRTDLDKVNPGNITLIADLTRIDEAGEVELSYSYSFPGDVAQNALSVQSRSPGTLRLMVANRITKEVPVQINWVGEAPDASMYLVDKENVILDNKTIMVTGPEMVIDQIDHAAIEVDLTDKTRSFVEDYQYTLCDTEGNGVDAAMVTTNVGMVSMELKIQYYKDIKLAATVVDGGGATAQTSSIVYDPETIRVSGDQKVLSKITEINLGTINLGELTEETVLPFNIVLDEGLTNLTGVTEANVTVSFPDLETKVFSVTEIQALNVPEGMIHELAAKVLKVTVRGPRNVVNRMSVKDIGVSIDFADMSVGTATFKAEIAIDTEKFPGVGAMGVYNVAATLQEAVDPAAETGSQTTN